MRASMIFRDDRHFSSHFCEISVAWNPSEIARMAELVDALDSKSCVLWTCGFETLSGYQRTESGIRVRNQGVVRLELCPERVEDPWVRRSEERAKMGSRSLQRIGKCAALGQSPTKPSPGTRVQNREQEPENQGVVRLELCPERVEDPWVRRSEERAKMGSR